MIQTRWKITTKNIKFYLSWQHQFDLLFGVKKLISNLREIVEQEVQSQFKVERDELRNKNCKTYNLRHKPANKYNVNDLVVIK